MTAGELLNQLSTVECVRASTHLQNIRLGNCDITYNGNDNIEEQEGLSLEDTKNIITIEEAIMIQEQPDEMLLVDDTNIVTVQEQEIIDGIC